MVLGLTIVIMTFTTTAVTNVVTMVAMDLNFVCLIIMRVRIIVNGYIRFCLFMIATFEVLIRVIRFTPLTPITIIVMVFPFIMIGIGIMGGFMVIVIKIMNFFIRFIFV